MIFTLLSTVLLNLVTSFNVDVLSPHIVTNKNGLFGFSTALHKTYDQAYVLVGSPNGESGVPRVKNPGVIYKCPLGTVYNDVVVCDTMVDVFNDGENLFQSGRQVEEKSDQFLGVTLRSVDEFVVACAHRYMNYFRPELYTDPSHQPIGRCIQINQELDEKLNPDIKPCDNDKDDQYQTYGSCQAGSSLHLHSYVDEFGFNVTTLSIGTPGLFNWTGGGEQSQIQEIFIETPTFLPKTQVEGEHDTSLTGYSIVVCDMDGTSALTVTGGPRGNGYRGKVFIYAKTETDFILKHVLNGDQFGSYFGNKLVCADVNGDGYKDLMVGAPWYTDYTTKGYKKSDSGRLYIFYGSENLSDMETNHIQGDKESVAFSFSMDTAGDINKDGFEDIFVGAPYSDSGVGAVFLYLGSKDGLQSKYSQKITPQTLSFKPDNMHTFGYSISSGKDMDSNGYPDVAIGAYGSRHVVYLRSTAIINVIPHFVFSAKKINPKKATLEIPGTTKKVAGTTLKICLKYDGDKTDTVAEVNLVVSLDTIIQSNRVYFDFYSPKSKWDTSLTVDLNSDTADCSLEKNVYLHDGIQDVRPVEVSVSAELATTAESFNARKVLNQKVIRETKGSIAIVTKCNEESGKCKVDLDLTIPDYTFEKSDKYPAVVYNRVDYVYPRIIVRNNYLGLYNYTYNAYVTISLSTHLQYEEVQSANVGEKVSCESIEDNKVKCKIPSLSSLNDPMNPQQELVLKLKLINIYAPIDQIIKAVVNPSEPSVEENNDNNSAELAIVIKELADLVIRGGASQAKVVFNNKYTLVNDIIASKEVEIRHTIRLDLHEESERQSLEDIKLNIYWPMKTHGFNGRYILPITSILISETPDGGGILCEPSLKELYDNIGSVSEGTVGQDSGNIVVDEIDDTFYLMDTETTETGNAIPSIGEYYSIDCAADTSNCVKFQCSIERIEVSLTDQRIGGFKMSIISKVHEANLFGVKELNITSYAEVISVGGGLILPRDRSLSLKTRLLPSVTKSRNYLWLIILGIIGGLFLLLLIIIILWRCGFFRRNQPPVVVADRIDERLTYT